MNRVFRIAALLLAVCTAVLCFAACQPNTPPVVDPLDDTTTTVASTTTASAYPTHTTVPARENQLTLMTLLDIHAPVLPWSLLESYDHTKTGDNTAEFVVADNFGHECKLNVTIDPDSGNLTEAVLSYGDVTANVLDESSLGLLNILTALNKE